MFEQDKFEILFEKVYMRHVLESLNQLINHKVVELMPDGTESPEKTEYNNLIKLVADLVSCPEFEKNRVINFYCKKLHS